MAITATLSDIRFLAEREVGATLEPSDIINWCNQVNMDIGTNIDIPSPTPQSITLLTTALEYVLNTDLKIIYKMRLKSDIDQMVDRELQIPYRIYNGKLIMTRVFWVVPDTLVVDYFKHMKYFTTIGDVIDIDDRFVPLYVFYCRLIHHNERKAPENVNWRVAINAINVLQTGYNNMKNQVISYYSLGNEPITVDGRWQG